MTFQNLPLEWFKFTLHCKTLFPMQLWPRGSGGQQKKKGIWGAFPGQPCSCFKCCLSVWLKGTRCKDAKTFKQDDPESYCSAGRRFCILVMGIHDRPGGGQQGHPTIYPSSEFAGLLSKCPWHCSRRVPVSQNSSRRLHTQSGAAAAWVQPLLCPGCFSGLVRSSHPDPGSRETFPERPAPAQQLLPAAASP